MKKILLSFCVLCSFSALFCFGKKDIPKENPQREKEYIEGIISMKGNEPHIFIVLTANDGTVFQLTGEKAEKLVQRQGQYMRLYGKKGKDSASPVFPATFTVTSFESVSYKNIPDNMSL